MAGEYGKWLETVLFVNTSVTLAAVNDGNWSTTVKLTLAVTEPPLLLAYQRCVVAD